MGFREGKDVEGPTFDGGVEPTWWHSRAVLSNKVVPIATGG